jgi:phosphate transport system substrate-binding protein
MAIHLTKTVKSIAFSTVLLAASTLTGCGGGNSSAPTSPTSAGTTPSDRSAARGGIQIDGSSTVHPLTEAIAEEFQKSSGTTVAVGTSGTGGGFKKFCRGETDISNASRPISAKEIAACQEGKVEYIEIPIAYDALTVVVSPQNTWAQTLKIAELKQMWEPAAQGKIKTWNQIRPDFPNAPLNLFGAGTNSGTFDYFTEAIVGKAKSSRGDYTATEDDNVTVQGLLRDKNALGYFGYSYYAANKDKLRAVGIDNGKGIVLPSEQTVLNGTYTPLSRPLFIYVSKAALAKPEVKAFVSFYLKNSEKLAREVSMLPLPTAAYPTIQQQIVDKTRVGTVFGGKEPVGLTIDDILKLPVK